MGSGGSNSGLFWLEVECQIDKQWTLMVNRGCQAD